MKHECIASTHQGGLVYLSSGAQHLRPLLCMLPSHHLHWVPLAHPTLLQREMEEKRFFLRIIGSLEEGATKTSQDSGTLAYSSMTAACQNMTHLPPDSHNRSKTFLLTAKVPNDEATDNIFLFLSSITKEHPTYFFTSSSSMTGAHFTTQI